MEIRSIKSTPGYPSRFGEGNGREAVALSFVLLGSKSSFTWQTSKAIVFSEIEFAKAFDGYDGKLFVTIGKSMLVYHIAFCHPRDRTEGVGVLFFTLTARGLN